VRASPAMLSGASLTEMARTAKRSGRKLTSLGAPTPLVPCSQMELYAARKSRSEMG
jgi:hypothetical protein